ncbi:hypothetical protein [Ignatzschineria indica]
MLPDLTIAFFSKSRAGSWQSLDYQKTFSASKMPTCGHAVVKRARW